MCICIGRRVDLGGLGADALCIDYRADLLETAFEV
jgi:hypothetical protein